MSNMFFCVDFFFMFFFCYFLPLFSSSFFPRIITITSDNVLFLPLNFFPGKFVP